MHVTYINKGQVVIHFKLDVLYLNHLLKKIKIEYFYLFIYLLYLRILAKKWQDFHDEG